MKKTFLSLLISMGLSTSVFADDLYQVYQMALEKDPTINRAEADKNAAFEGININRASLLPQISGLISYDDRTSESPVGSEFVIISRETESSRLSLTLDLSVYDHSNWVALSRAEKVAHQSDVSFALSKQELIVRTTQAYLTVLGSLDSLEFVQAEKRAIERQLEQTKQRFEVGLTAITDVHEAQANFDNTVAQEIRAENDVELRREELREITGKYHDNLSILNTEQFSATRPEPQQVADWLSIAEDKSLDLLVRKFSKDIAKEDIKSAKAGHYPTLSLRANASRDSTDLTISGVTSSFPIIDGRSITLNLNVPIYEGGVVNARIAQARFNFVAASEDLELTHRSTVRSVRSSYNDVVAAISEIRALQQSVVSAESALKATEAGFDVGTRTIVDVLDSTRNLYSAKRNLANARYNFITAVVALKRSAGSLKEQDIVDINRGLMRAKVS